MLHSVDGTTPVSGERDPALLPERLRAPEADLRDDPVRLPARCFTDRVRDPAPETRPAFAAMSLPPRGTALGF